MSIALLTLVAFIAYFASSFMIVRRLQTHIDSEDDIDATLRSFLPAIFAFAVHLFICVATFRAVSGVDFSVSGMLVLVSAIVTGIFLLCCLFMPVMRLGILVFPLGAASLGFAHIWNSEPITSINHSTAMNAHILVSIVAYSLLTIAAIQALLFVYQERQIKKRTNPALLMALPPLQTMEKLLFRLIAAGFLLLTVTLLSGLIFSQQIYGQPFTFEHHTVLALMGWAVFALLLYRRFSSGLRGTQAAVWTVCGYLLILLGYFGTKIVSESLNMQ
ncbi:MAG: cytochrome c biogenesis protein CcsA [Arenicella sp.]|nr:cytochrome c biogenesis protein CcsA [Arenicella sp.]